MKTNKYIYSLLIIIMAFVSCKNVVQEPKGELEQIIIDIPNLKFGEYQELIDSVRYIKLKLNDDYPLSSIRKVAFYDSLLYILDSTSKLLVYNKNGDFLFKIAEQGVGPKEYVELTDFNCSSSQSAIDLIDVSGRKILRYNMYSGKFIQMFSLKHFVYYGLMTDHNHYLCYDNSTNYFKINLDKKEYCKILKKSTDKYSYVMMSADYLFKHSNNQLGLFCFSNNTIYYIEEEAIPKYALLFDGYVTRADFPNDKMEDNRIDFENTGLSLMSVKDFIDWIYVRYGIEQDKSMHTFLYNKHSKKHYDFRGVSNFPGFMFLYPVAQETMDNCLILTSNNISITDYKSSLDHIPSSPEGNMLRKIIEEASDEDNPILQLIYLKKR